MTRRARASYLHTRLQLMTQIMGDGPWTWATAGRLHAASGLEPPALPWYAQPNDVNALSVAYWRERGREGFFNRHWRKRARYARHVLTGNDGA